MKKRIAVFLLFFSLILAFGVKKLVSFAPVEEAMSPVIRIAGTGEDEINCNTPDDDGMYTFEVDYTDTRSTESYIMRSIPYAPELSFENESNLGTELIFGGIDEFAPTINFFPFSFFDETTSRLAVGENGLISLDPQQGGQINLRYPSANIPNSTLTRNAIFASHYDLRIHDIPNAKVFYKIIGSFPARKLVITYSNAEVFYCTDDRKTSVQVVLEELTNRIQIYVKEKSMACGAVTNAVLGIQNKYGSLGYSPSGRNYDDGDWSATNEAYEFIPNGERVPSISWIEGNYAANDPNNYIIGNGETITVNADLTDLQYTVEIRYPNYTNALGEIVDLILTDDIQVSPFYPIALDETVVFCDSTVNLTDYNQFVSLNPANNFTITYYYDQALTNPVPDPTNFTFSGETILLYVLVAYNDDCYDVSQIELSSVLGLLQVDPDDLILDICDNVDSTNPEGTENAYLLSNLDDFVLGQVPNGIINYYSSATATNPITQLNISEGTQIWLDVLVSGPNGCRTPRIGPITINFYDVPEFLNIPTDLELILCDKNWDKVELFDNNQNWQSFLAANGLVTNNPNHIVTVYETEANAISATNALTQVTMDVNDPTYNPVDNSRNAVLYVRIEDENGCFSVKRIDTRIRFYGVDVIDSPLFNLCVSNSTSIPIDLSCFITNADFNNDGNFNEGMFNQVYFEDGTTSTDINDVYEITYHLTPAHANAGTNPVDPNQNITAADVGAKYFYVRFTLCESCTADGKDCYTVKRVRFRVVTTQPENEIMDVCHENNGETYVDNLNIFNYQLFSDPSNYTITYYLSQGEAQNQVNPINSYTFTGNNFLWVRIKSNFNFSNNSCFENTINPCEGVYRIRFVYGAVIEPINFPEQQVNGVCDNNADGDEMFDVTIFEDSIYQGEASFEYYNNMDESTLVLSGLITDPTQVQFLADEGTNAATKTIFIKLSYLDNSCYDIVRLTITLNFLPGIETAEGYLCACLPNPGEYSTFDLTNAVDQIFLPVNESNNNQLNEMVVSYYNYMIDAENGTNEILDPNNYQSIRGEEDIFVRFFSTESGCYSIDTLTLKNLVLPIPIPGQIDVCDTNINGQYDMILSDLDNIVMPNNTDGYFFSYYWNYDDAEDGVNPIIPTPDSDDSVDFFYEFNPIPEKIYVRVDADNGECPESSVAGGNICNGVNEVVLNIGTSLEASVTEFYLPAVCDTYNETGEINNSTYNDGIASGLDLTSMESDILNSIGLGSDNVRLLYYESLNDLENDTYPYGEDVLENPQNYTNTDGFGNPIDQVFIKVEYDDFEFCPIVVTLKITVLDGPMIFPDENYYLCPGGMVDVILNFPEGIDYNDFSYIFTLPDGTQIFDQHQLLNVNTVGNYSIQITDNATGCESPQFNFAVAEIPPPQISELIVEDENSITVIASGYGNLALEYSLDGENFQSSNYFGNLDEGLYTVWVRYNYNNQMCLGDPKSTILLKINNVLTPNGDGYNDCISFNNLIVFGEANTTLIMYDRYGKQIYTQSSNSVIEWCGMFGGRVLPSTNYWYKLILPDGRERSGYITLKNY